MSDSELDDVLREVGDDAPDLPAEGGPGPMAELQDSALRRFLGLFVVPLLVVVASVLVFIGFGWIAYESASISDYVDDMRSGWRPRRAQAAYEMSKILIADPSALDDEPGVKAQLLELFQESEDEEMRRYLALVLGYSRDPAAVPLLVEALDDEDSQLRIYALWGLGALGHPSAREPLTAALSDSDPGIRKTAAYALGELGEVGASTELERLLDDPVTDVRWNAALSLARLGDDAAVPVLERMLDRELLSQVPDITPEQQEDAMISAVEALTALRGEAALPTLAPLEESDPSLKVRQAAIDAREAVEAARAAGSGEA